MKYSSKKDEKLKRLRLKKTIVVLVIILLGLVVYNYLIFGNISYRELMQKKEAGPDSYPSEWAWEQRTFPYWKANNKAFRAEIKKAQQMRAEATNYKLEPIEFAGPTNIGGRISDIEFNPQDPNIVYAGAATGGVFKSTDMGLTWAPIFDDQAFLPAGDIAVDPLHPDTIYVGTGEPNGGHNNLPGGGVYKSIDGGLTWQFIGLGNTVSTGRIVIDPSNTQRIFVASVGSYFGPNLERGVYRSTDGGLTWTSSLFISDTTGAIDIVIDPNNPLRLISAMWERVRRPNSNHLYGPTSGIYRSLDGGNSWRELTTNLPDPSTTDVGRIGLALHQANPDIVYALYTDGYDYLGLYKTTNFGSSWTDADPDKEIDNGTPFNPFSWYFGQVRINPTNPNIIYAMDVEFMRSTNGGNSWSINYAPSLHVDHHALAFHPTNPSYLLEGNDGGINISNDGGVNWTKVANLPVTQFYEIGLDHNNPQRLYGGTQDNGTLRTLTGNKNDWDRIYGGDGFYVIVDFTNPNVIYAESQFGYLGKSTNGGSSFSPATNGINFSEPTNWSTPVVMDHNNNNVLYYGTDRVYKTTDGAGYWTAISPDLTDGIPGTRLGTLTTIGVSPVVSNVIWAGTDDSHVWYTTDGGTNWTDVSSTLPYRWVTRVIPDPQNEATAYVTFSGLKWQDPQPHVFKTTDLGQTWTDISSNLPDAPVNAFAVDPIYTDWLFAGTDLGAYYSANGGNDWTYISSDLPVVSVYDMKIHDTGHFLVLGTHARSMYKMDLAFITDVETVAEAEIISDYVLKQNYPNPFNPSTTIEFSVPKTEQVKIKIYNTTGQIIKEIANKEFNLGTHTVSWNGTNNHGNKVASGVYLYSLETGKQRITKKLTLSK
jgi:photosystem II stability/assembly factor-like uncharacterized protein